ncbi:hypothetical protein [Leptothoe sp. PORK10 BA2]|nr:hypothetical protein [Leptothoe sp. PORK10 BA2]MEA5466224.1 hypothetical protein [Leptothoe sp. PORK10 BA2]
MIVTRLQFAIWETNLAARLGGGEFVVVLEEITDLPEAVYWARHNWRG